MYCAKLQSSTPLWSGPLRDMMATGRALTTAFCTGLKQQQKAWLVWPSSVRRHWPVATSHSLSVKSSEAVHSFVPCMSQHTSDSPCTPALTPQHVARKCSFTGRAWTAMALTAMALTAIMRGHVSFPSPRHPITHLGDAAITPVSPGKAIQQAS